MKEYSEEATQPPSKQTVRIVLQIGERQNGVPSKAEMYNILKARSVELQGGLQKDTGQVSDNN